MWMSTSADLRYISCVLCLVSIDLTKLRMPVIQWTKLVFIFYETFSLWCDLTDLRDSKVIRLFDVITVGIRMVFKRLNVDCVIRNVIEIWVFLGWVGQKWKIPWMLIAYPTISNVQCYGSPVKHKRCTMKSFS